MSWAMKAVTKGAAEGPNLRTRRIRRYGSTSFGACHDGLGGVIKCLGRTLLTLCTNDASIL